MYSGTHRTLMRDVHLPLKPHSYDAIAHISHTQSTRSIIVTAQFGILYLHIYDQALFHRKHHIS
jgi:hypothetical protein